VDLNLRLRLGLRQTKAKSNPTWKRARWFPASRVLISTAPPGAHTFYNICTRMSWHFVV